MSSRRSVTTPGVYAFAIFVFLLTTMPRAGFRVGSAPVYFVDIWALIALSYASRLRAQTPGPRHFASLVGMILFFSVLGELAGAYQIGSPLDSVYLIVRTAIAFSVFYTTTQLVRTPHDLLVVLKACAVGLTVTAVLMALTSLPMTREAISNLVFSNRLLEPATDVEDLLGATAQGVRGRSLVGVSILSATFLNILWPLAALLAVWPMSGPRWRWVGIIGCFLAPLGILMSYSRGPSLGAFAIVGAALVTRAGRIRRRILVPVMAGAIAVLFIGVGSQVFDFERLVTLSEVAAEDPLGNDRERERVLAYYEPFVHLAEHPRFFLVGEGTAIRRYSTISEQGDKATHALFAQSYYSYGMFATILYIVIIARTLYFGMTQLKRGNIVTKALSLSTLAFIPWAAFEHTIVSTPRGAMLFFFVVGLVSVMKSLSRSENRPVATTNPRYRRPLRPSGTDQLARTQPTRWS